MMRVLFVDDDRAVLDGLRVRLRSLRGRWETMFTEGGPSALQIMSRGDIDVIVSDMRMPEMDGAQLLQVVSERWPQTVRIVLSGGADPEHVVRLVPVAHQYLSKPCDLAVLENVVDRCVALQKVLHEPALRRIVGKLRRLPPLPETYLKLQTAMQVESVPVHEIAQIVARDTVIAAKVMQLVNSAFFRLPCRIPDIEHAVIRLGLVTVRNLVASAEVFSRWPTDNPAQAMTFDRLQKHSLGVCAAAHALTAGTRFASDALLAAMLHDIGYWILTQEHSSALEEAMQLAATERLPLDEAERQVLGASHAEIGAYLLGLWGFPSAIIEAIAYHHQPQRVPQREFDVLAALSVAHALAEPKEATAFAGTALLHSEVDASYLSGINAPFDWTEATRRVAATRAQDGTPND